MSNHLFEKWEHLSNAACSEDKDGNSYGAFDWVSSAVSDVGYEATKYIRAVWSW